MPDTASTPRTIVRFERGGFRVQPDEVVTEEPLEIRLVRDEPGTAGEEQTVAVTMRTPGADDELVLGFLHAEGAVRTADDVLGVEVWTDGRDTNPNVIRVRLASGFEMLRSLSRNTFTSSACGVCGTGSIEQLAIRTTPTRWTAPPVHPDVLSSLPARLREHQELFGITGGLHGAGLVSAEGELLAVREDVGRHNAVDKLVGWALREGRLPLTDHLLVVSGRAGFEILQKAALAGIPIVASVSAPSSLAVDVAESFHITLAGFVREGRFNVYTVPERVAMPNDSP